MNRILRLGIVIGAAIGISAGMCALEDLINQPDKRAIINRYAHYSASEIRKQIKTPEDAQKFAEAVYGANGFCRQGAETIAYLLSDNNYPCRLLKIEKENWGFHWFFNYRDNFIDNGAFGKLKYRKIEGLIKHIEKTDNVHGIKYEIFNSLSSDFNPEKISEDVKVLYRSQKF